ncbi:MAG TPA: cyclopropane-fatty-acyl-phospholipid synthase family protein [Nevskiaceae bacterium]|nr:cyclopropane-fatty-acyl-phospholipid synthase family protein [Nevskiaceae bacterium]
MLQTLINLVGRHYANGTLIFETPSGKTWHIGRGEPTARILLKDEGVLHRILLHPQLAFGETYMEHGWEPENGNLRRVLEVALRMLSSAEYSHPHGKLIQKGLIGAAEWLHEANNPLSARRNIHQHYDLDYALYSQFLDRDLNYSCAYYPHPEMSLEEAQQAKLAHIAAKLDLQPGARVLDVGCGWGAMAMYLAEHFDCHVTGITLSVEQQKVARARAEERGLSDSVEFRLEDYRNTRGQFDSIVSVGMFEHVGRPQYLTYFRTLHNLLAKNGTALMHCIGRSTPPGVGNPWIEKYIFPGGYIPAASEVTGAIEPSGLILTDLEVLRVHYAQTLNDWAQRFAASRDDICQRMGERFCRMWEFYLQSCEMGFLWGDLVVFQWQMTRQLKRLPTTRDYLLAPATAGHPTSRHRVAGRTAAGRTRSRSRQRNADADADSDSGSETTS